MLRSCTTGLWYDSDSRLHSDFANQGIITKCQKVDKEGQRTLGIITKPDYLKTAASESLWVNLAQNKNIYFELGWHMLKNRSVA